MDLAKEVASLKAQLKDESALRRILEDWINTSLKATLEKHHTEIKTLQLTYESKITALEVALEKEVAARKKLTLWVKDNLGPNLDAAPFKDAVGSFSRPRAKSNLESRETTPSPSVSSKKPPSVTLPKPSSAVKSPRTRQHDEYGEESTSSDLHADEASSSAPGRTSAPSSSKTASKFAQAGVASSSSPVVNPALRSRVQKLASLEASVWGLDDVTETTFPSGDASIKSNKNRIEYYLQQQKHAANNYSSASLIEKTTLFMQKGVKVVYAPLTESDLKRDSFNFAILTSDRLFPICPDGLIRSQVMYLVLQGIKRHLGVSTGLELPHGARFGYDPFVAQDHSTDQNQQFQHIAAPKLGREVTAFQNAFGCEKVPRFGQDAAGTQQFHFDKTTSKAPEAEKAEIAKHRKRLREYFDLYYYGSFKSSTSSKDEGRIVLVVFGSAVPIVIDRLSEVNYRFDLSKVTLLALPYPTDRLTAADTNPEDYIAAYKFYASLFTPILDSKH
jgi:hypothetical protein